MRRWLFLLLLLTAALPAWSRHGKGGLLTYEYIGPGSVPNTTKYRVTATHYIDCDGTQFTETHTFLGIFNGTTRELLRTIIIPKTAENIVRKTSFGCINPPPVVCYSVATYVQEVELVNNTAGYILAEQECCRITGIVNLVNSSAYGITNSATIPGVMNGIAYRQNSSPQFAPRDTAVICFKSFFRLDLRANDPDGDSLSYAFCAAQTGGNSGQRQPNPPAAPPYNEVIYASGFSGGSPLGSGVAINAQTGMVSGTAPANTGRYVIAVCVSEYRGGVLIATTKKEIQVEVANCNLSAAVLQPEYINCNSFSSTFENENFTSEIVNYSWDFGVPGTDTDVSNAQRPTFTYPDTGRYVVKLKVSTASGCTDSTTADVAVYPGFSAGFAFSGSCFQSPFQFTDTTRARYGVVNSWKWSFSPNGSSAEQNPVYQFADVGAYTATLMVRSSKGCADTITKTINVYNRPDLSVAFRDTLICSIDTLQLQAFGRGDFSWTPSVRMLEANTATPRVFPTDTTTYVVTLKEQGCIATDTVRVAVLPFITVQLPGDTTICRGDSIQLRTVSHALQYRWTPQQGLSNRQAKAPRAAPDATTVYRVIANLGRCQDEALMQVRVVPYPKAFAGGDTVICYNTQAQLNGSITGSAFQWTPANTLMNANTLSPTATPLQSTAYVLTVGDTIGCPKPVHDTVLVQVIPQILANAGNDTAVIAGQPLQLEATGGDTYYWRPEYLLNNPNTAKPVAVLDRDVERVSFTVQVGRDGCTAADTMQVLVYKMGADILVPTAFTPNGDGRNDVLKPILIGMKNLEQFQVYNRWGQLVYSTRTPGQGWDGRMGGKPQGSGIFVYLASGESFEGKKLVRKGTVMLVR